ncbi:zf-HC2 domain-containing protein [bacterium]|nr:zf-HC2 domain-containing protein [bacterium]
MLSDFLEQLLPAARHDEVARHLDTCPACNAVRGELQDTLRVAGAFAFPTLTHETALRITEACHAGTRRVSFAKASRVFLVAAVPLALLVTTALVFPRAFPWLERFKDAASEAKFARYFPLVNGAGEVIEEHANWLHAREPAMRSLWEEGGITPEEFEKNFTGKPNTGEETK